MKSATLRMERVALKWRNLAERRRDHLFDLYRSKRWTRYYGGQAFMDEMDAAIAVAERWAAIAPRPDEFAGAAVADALRPAA